MSDLSRMPAPTSRSRSTISGLSAYPSERGTRPANSARYGSFVSRRQWLDGLAVDGQVPAGQDRVSSWKTPCGCSGWMSPLAEEIQNDDPSTRVTVPDPKGPAAVSAFHPAIADSFNGLTPLRRRPAAIVARPQCQRPHSSDAAHCMCKRRYA